MVHAELIKESGILILKPEGKFEAADFEHLSQMVDPYIMENKSLNGLLIESNEFPGWSDFTAMLSHIRFVKDHHKVINKIAIVSDNKFVSNVPELAKHLIHPTVKHFEMSQRAEALNWLGFNENKRPEQTI